MALNKSSAISYNKNRGYSQQAITIIQTFANAKTTGVFDNQTVEAIYKMQQSPLYPFKLVADGKIGPGTLGLIIMELEHAGRMSEAAVLRSYPYNIQGVAGEINPIESFVHWTSDPLKLRTDGSSWFSMDGSFNVKLKLSPSVDPKRYEYRQKIKGEAWSQRGDWNATKTVWTATGNWIDEGEKFKIPAQGVLGKGLLKNHWKEDGEDLGGGKAEKFGYRSTPATIIPGLRDFYVPNQNGPEYVLQDTFGIRKTTPYVSGVKLWLELFYMGCVIDNLKPGDDKTIFSKQWHYKCEDVLK
jgi:hypothetical protein